MKQSDALKECEGIRAEIAQLEKDIQELDSKPYDSFGTDCVVGSSRCEPFQKHAITIAGRCRTPEVIRQIDARKRKIKKFALQLTKMQNAAEDYLETVSNAIDRVILRGYYIDGKQWKDVATELTKNTKRDFTEAAVKMRAKRFFEKN